MLAHRTGKLPPNALAALCLTMHTGFQLFPESASTISGRVDALYFFLVGLTIFFTVLVASLIVFFALRYRQSRKVNRDKGPTSYWMEISWMILPLPVLMFIFSWGASLYFSMHRVPDDAMEFNVVAKQWMWKFQHPQGRREIDELHVPEGRPVRLKMISQDVIHSLYVPAFRVKQDVLPGRYTDLWFEANKLGEYHLFCAEYCGTNHSRMTGKVIVMKPNDYESWLAGNRSTEPPEVVGAKLFLQHRCDSCHVSIDGAKPKGPPLEDLFARPVPLANGTTITADENYLRESILYPQKKLVAGYQPIMPTFEGQISEEDIADLIAYIKSLGRPKEAKP